MPRLPPRAAIATALLLAVSACARPSSAAAPVLIDDFEDVSRWSPHPADGVEMRLSAEGVPGARTLRIDFKFAGGAGYAVARRAVDLALPENYAFAFRIRAEAPANNLEFKLIDSTGANVWWCNQRDVEFPRAWQPQTIKSRHISFAWGPSVGGR